MYIFWCGDTSTSGGGSSGWCDSDATVQLFILPHLSVCRREKIFKVSYNEFKYRKICFALTLRCVHQ